MTPTDPLTHAEEAAAFDRLLNDPRKVEKIAPAPLKWFCVCCGDAVASPLTGCECGGRCAPDFMRLS